MVKRPAPAPVRAEQIPALRERSAKPRQRSLARCVRTIRPGINYSSCCPCRVPQCRVTLNILRENFVRAASWLGAMAVQRLRNVPDRCIELPHDDRSSRSHPALLSPSYEAYSIAELAALWQYTKTTFATSFSTSYARR